MWKGKRAERMIKGQKGDCGKIAVRGILFYSKMDDRNVISQSVKSVIFFFQLSTWEFYKTYFKKKYNKIFKDRERIKKRN